MSENSFDISRLWKWLSLGLILIVSFLLFHSKVSDFDIWWHLAGGRWIMDNLSVPILDPFSFTSSDKEWIDLHWLFQLIAYASYRIAGSEGLILIRTVFLTAALLLVIRYGYKGRSGFAAILGGLVFILIGQINFITRPYIITFFLLALTLTLLEIHSRRRGREIFFLVPIMILWVNCHALFATGLGLIAAWGFGEFMDYIRHKKLREDSNYIIRLAVVSVLAVAVCLINPYHIHGFLFPLELWTRISGEIAAFSKGVTEFASPFSIPVWVGPVFFYKISIPLIFIALIFRGSKVRSAEVLIVILFGFISYKAVRNLSLWAVVAGPVIARNIGELLQALHRRRPERAPALNRILYAALCLLLCAHIFIYAHSGIRHRLYGPSMFGSGNLAGRFPQGAADFIEKNNLYGNGFNCFEDGGYLIWRLAPKGYKDFIDGRLEVHDKAMYATYRNSLSSPEHLASTLDKFNLNYAILRYDAAYATAGLALNPEWVSVYLDDVSLLIVRMIPEHQDLIRKYGIDLSAMSTGQAEGLVSEGGFKADRMENLGVVFMHLGRMDLARYFFKEASSIPGHARAELFLGMEAFDQGRLDEAGKRMECALKGSPKNRATVYSILAEISQKENDTAREIRHLKKALQANMDDCSFHERLGWAYIREGSADNAIDDLHASLKCSAPENIKARRWMAFGMALLADGRLDDAEKAARKALAIDPGLTPARQLLDETQKQKSR